MIGSPYYFEGDAPTAAEILHRAEELGGLPISVTLDAGSSDEFEFSFLAGKVNVSTGSDRVFLTSYAGEAPVLHDLLCVAIEDLGGRRRVRDASAEPELTELACPLTEEGVVQATTEFRAKLKRLARRAWLMLAALIALGLSAVVAVVWVVLRWLSG